MLDRAAALFASKGYAGSSLQELADALGMQKGSLYHWIGSKEDLLAAIIEEAHDTTIQRNVRWRDEPDPLEALRLFVTDHVGVAMDHVLFTTVYLQEFSSLSPPRRRQILAARDDYEKGLREILERARDEGQTRSGLDPRLAAMTIFGMVNWISVWYRPDGSIKPAVIARQFAEMAVSGVVPAGKNG